MGGSQSFRIVRPLIIESTPNPDIQARLKRLCAAGAAFVEPKMIEELARNMAGCDRQDVTLETVTRSIQSRIRGIATVRPWPLPPDQVEHMARALLEAF